MAKQQSIVGISTTNITDSNYGVPVSFHRIERIEIAPTFKKMIVTLAGYFNEAVAESGMQPMTRNSLAFDNYAIEDNQTMQQIRDALYRRAVNPEEGDADTFATGTLVEKAS